MSCFFSFSHMPYPSPPPHKERTPVKRLFPNFSRVTAFYRVGGRENSKIFLKTLHWYKKTTATYNELLDETRDKHYYILNR